MSIIASGVHNFEIWFSLLFVGDQSVGTVSYLRHTRNRGMAKKTHESNHDIVRGKNTVQKKKMKLKTKP